MKDRIIKIISIITLCSLTLCACNSKEYEILIDSNKSISLDRNDVDLVECSHTSDVKEVYNELHELYSSINEKTDGYQIPDYIYFNVQNNEIYRISFKDDEEHTIIFSDNNYIDYAKYGENTNLCVVSYQKDTMPNCIRYKPNSDVELKIKGTDFIFYGNTIVKETLGVDNDRQLKD